MITNEQRERILAAYRPWIYGYKRLARELGLTRDQVRQVIVTATNQRRRKPPFLLFIQSFDLVLYGKHAVSVQNKDVKGMRNS